MTETGLIIGLVVGIFFMLAYFFGWFTAKNDEIIKLKNPKDEHLKLKITITKMNKKDENDKNSDSSNPDMNTT
jgi:hypothetical protein